MPCKTYILFTYLLVGEICKLNAAIISLIVYNRMYEKIKQMNYFWPYKTYQIKYFENISLFC